jgi:hypothetical protein
MLATRTRSPNAEASTAALEAQGGGGGGGGGGGRGSFRNSSADFEEKVKQCREHITKLAADTRKPAVSSGGAQGSMGGTRGGGLREASFLRDMASKLAFNAVASPTTTEAGAAQDKRDEAPMSQTAPLKTDRPVSQTAPVKTRTPLETGATRELERRSEARLPRSPGKGGGSGVWAR